MVKLLGYSQQKR